ncbi:MAG: TlyA family RNA methyltransferase [Anaerolineales bacterium]
MKKERVDRLLVQRGLAENLDWARRILQAGEILVEGRLVDKPGARVSASAEITRKEKPPYVSRGGEKLAAALDRFPVQAAGQIVADIGASTGGFTDCVLQRGAAKVYAIDVGYGQLAWTLRQDPRVEVMERVNARHLASLPEPVNLIVSDVSFISLATIYATAVGWLAPEGEIVSLIKPQFEARRTQVEKGGVVRDPAVHRQVLEEATAAFAALDVRLRGLMASPLRGPAGNIEFLGWWTRGIAEPATSRSAMIVAALREAHTHIIL